MGGWHPSPPPVRPRVKAMAISTGSETLLQELLHYQQALR